VGKNLLAIAVATIILLSGIFGSAYLWIHSSDEVYYEGTEVFLTEQDYKEFKMLFVDPQVQLLDASVLTSEPPIIVRFKVQVPSPDYGFPYGKKDWVGTSVRYTVVATTLLVFALAFIPILLMHSRFNKEE